ARCRSRSPRARSPAVNACCLCSRYVRKPGPWGRLAGWPLPAPADLPAPRVAGGSPTPNVSAVGNALDLLSLGSASLPRRRGPVVPSPGPATPQGGGGSVIARGGSPPPHPVEPVPTVATPGGGAPGGAGA